MARIPCPNCGKPAAIGKDNPWRPFCSQRCKLIDLGEWLAEEHRIPDESAPGDAGEPWDKNEDPPPSQH